MFQCVQTPKQIKNNLWLVHKQLDPVPIAFLGLLEFAPQSGLLE